MLRRGLVGLGALAAVAAVVLVDGRRAIGGSVGVVVIVSGLLARRRPTV